MGPGRRSWTGSGWVRRGRGRRVDGERGLHRGPRPSARRRSPPRAAPGHPGKGEAVDHEPASTGREALDRSRGGLTTTVHLVAGRRCRPVARLISPGRYGDSPYFPRVLERVRIACRGPAHRQTSAHLHGHHRRRRPSPGSPLGDRVSEGVILVSGWRGTASGKAQDKACSSLAVLNGQGSLVCFRYLPCDRQPQPGPSRVPVT
jgi:hypothetical protein